jgi:hypothetical protein
MPWTAPPASAAISGAEETNPTGWKLNLRSG